MNLKKKEGALDELKRRQATYDNILQNISETTEKKLTDLTLRINKFISEVENEHQELFEKINKTYKTAVAVGLSKAYKQAKEAHKKSLNVWSIGLVLSILAMLAVPFLLEAFVLKVPLSQLDTLTLVFKRILTYLPFISPMIFLSYIASKNMNGYRRMYEEYLYKESLSLTYEGLKEEIEDLEEDSPTNELMRKLLRQSLDAAQQNPSSHLDSIDGDMYINMIASVMNAKSIKFSGGSLLHGAKLDIEDYSKDTSKPIDQSSDKTEKEHDPEE